jgi:hypothetical protein
MLCEKCGIFPLSEDALEWLFSDKRRSVVLAIIRRRAGLMGFGAGGIGIPDAKPIDPVE